MPNENITISIQNNVIISGHNWNQSDDIELPYNVAPEISNYERGKNYCAAPRHNLKCSLQFFKVQSLQLFVDF